MYSKQHQVDDMGAVLDACGVRQAVFLGHSMGAYDSMLFFLSDPERAKRMRSALQEASSPKGQNQWGEFVPTSASMVWILSCRKWRFVGLIDGGLLYMGGDYTSQH